MDKPAVGAACSRWTSLGPVECFTRQQWVSTSWEPTFHLLAQVGAPTVPHVLHSHQVSVGVVGQQHRDAGDHQVIHEDQAFGHLWFLSRLKHGRCLIIQLLLGGRKQILLSLTRTSPTCVLCSTRLLPHQQTRSAIAADQLLVVSSVQPSGQKLLVVLVRVDQEHQGLGVAAQTEANSQQTHLTAATENSLS